MKDQKVLRLLRDGKIWFVSFLGIGFFPWMPGTVGSFFTLPILYWLGKQQVSFEGVWGIIILLFIASSWVAHKVEKQYAVHDPPWIVIDEVLGMLCAWSFVRSVNFLDLFLIFILFRIFDISKVWPASWVDSKMTNGIGAILDDFICGLYAGLLFVFIKYYFL